MKVRNMTSENTGRAIPNQFIITDDRGATWFQSYKTMIAVIGLNDKITLDKNYWAYSVTTGKYRNQFLGESKAETLKKIKSGEYKLADLN